MSYLRVLCLLFISVISAYINSSQDHIFIHNKYKLGLVVLKKKIILICYQPSQQFRISFPWVEFASLIKLPQ